MNFIQKHKRIITIVLIAIIIIATAYYFTIGKQKRQTATSTDSNSSTGSSFSTSTSTGFAAPTFPLKWGVYNGNTTQLQKRLNLSVTTCNVGSKISEDGILGAQTVAAIKGSFPNIGASVESNRQVSETQFNTIINSKPNCA